MKNNKTGESTKCSRRYGLNSLMHQKCFSEIELEIAWIINLFNLLFGVKSVLYIHQVKITKCNFFKVHITLTLSLYNWSIFLLYSVENWSSHDTLGVPRWISFSCLADLVIGRIGHLTSTWLTIRSTYSIPYSPEDTSITERSSSEL